MATAPLVQSKSYFEVKLQQGGNWSIGVATQSADLNNTKGGQDKESWCLCSDNIIYNNGNKMHELEEQKTNLSSNNIIDVNDTSIQTQPNATGNFDFCVFVALEKYN
jgi:hypothetical protein